MDKPRQDFESDHSLTNGSQELRTQAEALFGSRYQNLNEDTLALSHADVQNMLHELRVHQIELEMQNEELRRIQSEMDTVRAHYFELYDLAPVGYCTISKGGMLLQSNLTAAAILWMSRNELAGKPFTNFIFKEDRDIFYLLDRQLVEPGAARQCELRMIRKGGTLVWVSLDALVVLNAKMEPEIRIVLIDITERSRTQLKMHASNEKLKRTKGELEAANLHLTQTRQQLSSFIQHAPVSIAMFDLDMNYLACSDDWIEEYGRGRDNLIGCNHYQLNPDLPEEWKRLHQLGLAGAELRNNEDSWDTADGKRHWMSWALQPWRDENGVIGGIIISTDNISERKLSEIKLSENERRLNGFFEAAMDAIITVGEDYRIQLFNPAASKMFGISAKAAVGASLDLIIPPRFIDEHRIHVQNFGRENQRARGMSMFNSVTGIRADGSEFPLEATISGVASEGHQLYTVIIRDRTLQVQAENEIRSYQNQLRGLVAHQNAIKEEERIRIAREIHDELGSVLTGVKANLSVALHEEIGRGQTPNKRLLEATSLLDTAVETVRKVITELRPSVLDQLGIWAALEWYAQQIQERTEIRCTVSIDSSVASTELDPERSTALFRVAQEALTNVMRHAQATAVEIRLAMPKDMLCMEIEDNGIGIDSARTGDKKSWGIAGMVERIQFLGGSITITDTAHGTLVSLQLPMEQQDD